MTNRSSCYPVVLDSPPALILSPIRSALHRPRRQRRALVMDQLETTLRPR
jgi:hypothetical protein